MSHTPAPWHYRKGEILPGFVVGREDGYLFATVEEEEDARLIAAAPELLEAAKEGLEIIEGEAPHMDLGADKLRKAIAKAEGKE